MHHIRLSFIAAVLVAVATGCPQCAPDAVGKGVSQLTIRNVGAMTSLVNDDTNCGFESDAVKAAATTTGDLGGLGTLTLTVENCVIDAGADTLVSTDCKGVETHASGKITISATRTIGGILAGGETVVPAGPDSLTIAISKATADNFEASTSASLDKLKMVSGSIAATVSPRLAVAASNGACAIPTSNVAFDGVKYTDAKLVVTSEKNGVFDADVAESNLTAQAGVGQNGENAVLGTMTVYGSAVADIGGNDPKAPEYGQLDPDYDADKFADGYNCAPDFKDPESFDCPAPVQQIADGAARLTIQLLGAIAGIVDRDDACGFASDAARGSAALDGTPGGPGSVTTTVTACTIALPAGTALEADCNGDNNVAEGSITVTATKKISGRLTGNADTPVVPNNDQPATLAFSAIVVEDFRVSSGDPTNKNALTGKTGTLAGSVTPRTALSSPQSDGQGSCSIASPNAFFDGVTWTTADLLVSGDAGSFGLLVDTASLSAVNGTVGASTNTLAGSMTIGGDGGGVFSVPSGEQILDPDFDQAAFDSTWQCDPDLVIPVNFAQCSFAGTIGTGAAALTAQLFGTLVSVVDADTTCGFSAPAVGGTPSFVGGDVGDDGVTATFTIGGAGCEIAFPNATVVSTNCNGETTSVAGTVTVTGTKSVTGIQTGDPTEPIIPTTSTPAAFDLAVTFDAQTQVTTNPAGSATLIVRSGTLGGALAPRVGLDGTTGACSIGTPNVAFTDVEWTDGDVTLISDGSSFNMLLNTSGIDAASGNPVVGGGSNTLDGFIDVDGESITLGGPLDPAFDQTAFDSDYICAANGDPVLLDDAACRSTFLGVLGQGAARLLVKAAATAVSVHDANPICGFADATPDTATVNTPSAAPPAPGTILQTSDANCQSGATSADQVIATDCLGTETQINGGYVTAAGTKFVDGLFTGSAAAPFVPVTRDAATLTIGPVVFAGWQVTSVPTAGAITAVTVTSGTANLVVDPVAGRNDGASGLVGTDVFNVSTGIAGISNLTMATGDMVFTSEGKTFHVVITDADVDAFAGAFFDGANQVGTNEIAGTITVNGETVAVGGPLADPYDQAVFDSTYTCNPTLNGDVVPSAP